MKCHLTMTVVMKILMKISKQMIIEVYHYVNIDIFFNKKTKVMNLTLNHIITSELYISMTDFIYHNILYTINY